MELARGGGGGGALLSGVVPCRGERRGEHEREGERAGVSGEERSAVGRKRSARGAESGRLRRAAGVAGTWPPRGGRALPRSERRAGTSVARAEAGQTRVGLGWAEAKRAALREARWAGFDRGPRNEAVAREGRKEIFRLYFQEIFKYQLSNIILSKKMTSFENVPKMKVD